MKNNTFKINKLNLILYAVPALLLLLLPSLIWGGRYGHNALNIGGDYPGLLFLDPISFLKQSVQISIHALNSEYVYSQYWSLGLVSALIKFFGLGPQLFIDGLVLSLTYLGVSTLIRLTVRTDRTFHIQLASCIGGVVSVFSPLIEQNLFSYFQPGTLLLAFTPWICVNLIKYTESGKTKYVIYGSISMFFASPGIADIPYSFPCLLLFILLIPMFIWVRKVSLQSFFSRFAMFSILNIALNALWIVPWLIFMGPSNVLKAQSSGVGHFVDSLVPYGNLIDSLTLRNSEVLSGAFNWSSHLFSGWYSNLTILGLLPIFVVVTGYAIEAFSKEHEQRSPLTCTILGSVIFFGFLTLKFPPYSLTIYHFFLNHLAIFISTRNYYVTFLIPFVLIASMATGHGFYYLTSKFSFKYAAIFMILFTSLFSFYGSPLIKGRSFQGDPPGKLITHLPSGYVQAVKIVQSSKNRTVLSLPFTNTGSDWTIISDGTQGGASYMGISPMSFNDGIENFVSMLSFNGDKRGRSLLNLVKNNYPNNVSEVAQIVRGLNIQWVLINEFPMNDSPNNRLFAKNILKFLPTNKVFHSNGFTLYKIAGAKDKSLSLDHNIKSRYRNVIIGAGFTFVFSLLVINNKRIKKLVNFKKSSKIGCSN